MNIYTAHCLYNLHRCVDRQRINERPPALKLVKLWTAGCLEASLASGHFQDLHPSNIYNLSVCMADTCLTGAWIFSCTTSQQHSCPLSILSIFIRDNNSQHQIVAIALIGGQPSTAFPIFAILSSSRWSTSNLCLCISNSCHVYPLRVSK